MFGWLVPRPPLDPLDKAWVETHLLTLTRHFGFARLLETPVALPTPEFLGGDWDASSSAAQRLTQRVADHLRMRNPGVKIEFCAPGQSCCGGGGCEPGTLSVEPEQAYEVEIVGAAVAHELAGTLLPAEMQALRHAWLTDLLCVYSGLGVFIANAAVRQSADATAFARIGRLRPEGFMPARLTGYALALCAWVRQEHKSPWKHALQRDASTAFSHSLRYLERTGDSVFNYETATRPAQDATTLELLRQLQSGSPSARVATLWQLRPRRHGSQAAHAVAECLHDRWPAIRQEAALTLGCYADHARPELAALLDLLLDDQVAVRSAAATALGALGHDLDAVLPRLIDLLRDSDRDVVASAAFALENFGAPGLSAVPALLSALQAALVRCDRGLADTVARALCAIDADAPDVARAFLAHDYELRELLNEVLSDLDPR